LTFFNEVSKFYTSLVVCRFNKW